MSLPWIVARTPPKVPTSARLSPKTTTRLTLSRGVVSEPPPPQAASTSSAAAAASGQAVRRARNEEVATRNPDKDDLGNVDDMGALPRKGRRRTNGRSNRRHSTNAAPPRHRGETQAKPLSRPGAHRGQVRT
ncbi:MAG: hypothetical protein U1F67_02850 [Rubrivivax sp.]